MKLTQRSNESKRCDLNEGERAEDHEIDRVCGQPHQNQRHGEGLKQQQAHIYTTGHLAKQSRQVRLLIGYMYCVELIHFYEKYNIMFVKLR